MAQDHYDSLWRQSRTHTAYRTGIVSAQRLAPPAVRVTFPNRDNKQSWWLSPIGLNTQSNKDFWLPDIGEQVACLMDANDEDGCVIGSVWSTVDSIAGMTADKRHTVFSDGTVFEYDRSTHVYSITLGTGGSLLASTPTGSKINMDAAGNVTTTSGSGALCKFSNHGAAVSDALVLVSKLLAQFNAHQHTGVQTGGGNTGPPAVALSAPDVQSDLVKTSN